MLPVSHGTSPGRGRDSEISGFVIVGLLVVCHISFDFVMTNTCRLFLTGSCFEVCWCCRL